MRTRLPRGLRLAPLLAALLVLGLPRTAHAQNQLSLEAAAAFPSAHGADNGFGLGARFGHQWRIPLLSIVPELGFRYDHFSGPASRAAWAIYGGGRVGIGFIIQPSVFLHAGVGHEGGPQPGTSLAYDLGAALDVTAFPVIDFGPQLVYAGIAGSGSRDAISWLELGGHLTFNFGD